MCKFWMSACTACIVVMMTIGSASAHGYVKDPMRSLAGTRIHALSLGGSLEKRVLLQNKIGLGQNFLRLGYELRRLESIRLKSSTDLGQLNLKQWHFQAKLGGQRLSDAEAIEATEATRLERSIGRIKASSLPGLSIDLNAIDEEVSGQL